MGVRRTFGVELDSMGRFIISATVIATITAR